MVEIFLRTLPFFAIIGLGYWAGRARFFSEEATAYLTKFVFFFALSAMLFRFAATLPFEEIFDGSKTLATCRLNTLEANNERFLRTESLCLVLFWPFR